MPKGDLYSKHFYRFADEYPDVYDDDAALALWHRLVRLGDMAWPAAATLPYGTSKRALALLVECELVYLEGRSTYRIRGMDKERQARSDKGKHAVEQRWKYAGSITPSNTASTSQGITPSNTQDIPNRVEQSKTEYLGSTYPNRGIDRVHVSKAEEDPG